MWALLSPLFKRLQRARVGGTLEPKERFGHGKCVWCDPDPAVIQDLMWANKFNEMSRAATFLA